MKEEVLHYIRTLARAIYVTVDEEDIFLRDLHEKMKEYEKQIWVFNSAHGMLGIHELIRDWDTREHKVGQVKDINGFFEHMYKDDPGEKEHFFVLQDPEKFLKDEHIQRRFLNLMHHLHYGTKVKVLICIGTKKAIPEKLARYFEFVDGTGLSRDEVEAEVKKIADQLKLKDIPPNVGTIFAGLTKFEIDQSMTQSGSITKKDTAGGGRRIDPSYIAQYRKKQLQKTDLLTLVDTSKFQLDDVGGLNRFKEWAVLTKGSFSEKGRKFGLKPPRGVLLAGIYGCGKSLSTKTLSKLWDLPLVQLELGKLMSSGVGESEGNLYKALKMIDAISPCILWIDEAEKSLAGGQSSGRSDAGTTSRVLGILSTWIQETDSQVTLALTANSVKSLPPEIVNRMDERFFFDLPTQEDRIDIIKIHIRAVGQNPEDFKLVDLAEASSGMVGREIFQSVGQAMTKSFHAGKAGLDNEILMKEFESKPRIMKTMTDDVQEMLDWVGYDPEKDEGIRARFASDRKAFEVISGG